MPAFRQVITNVEAAPMHVTRASAATRHCQPGSGHSGSPSSITRDERMSSADTSVFHIIQVVVLNQRKRAPGFRSHIIV